MGCVFILWLCVNWTVWGRIVSVYWKCVYISSHSTIKYAYFKEMSLLWVVRIEMSPGTVHFRMFWLSSVRDWGKKIKHHRHCPFLTMLEYGNVIFLTVVLNDHHRVGFYVRSHNSYSPFFKSFWNNSSPFAKIHVNRFCGATTTLLMIFF